MLRVRIRDPVPFSPLDPGFGMEKSGSEMYPGLTSRILVCVCVCWVQQTRLCIVQAPPGLIAAQDKKNGGQNFKKKIRNTKDLCCKVKWTLK